MRELVGLVALGATAVVALLTSAQSGFAHAFFLVAFAAVAFVLLRPFVSETAAPAGSAVESAAPINVAAVLFPERFPFGRKARLGFLAAILLFAAVLRIYRLDSAPSGFFCDEASIGYNAYCLLKTGRDSNGLSIPLFVPSFASFLNPVYVYTTVASEALFDLSVTSVRLVSAFYGVLAVLGLYLLGQALFGPAVGLLAALLLAASPWHLHFSRISFELISLPAIFMLGMAFLMRALRTDSKRQLVVAAAFLGLTPYCYAVAQLFVPLMLLAVLVLFPKEIWQRRRGILIGLGVLFVVLLPLIEFHRTNAASMSRFHTIGIIQPGLPFGEVWRRFWDNYQQYVSFRFLFREGDPLLRHSVRGFGENLLSWAPWVAVGLFACLAHLRRGLFVWWWLLAFPVAAALIQETPSATRSIVGAPLFPLLAAIGLVAVWNLFRVTPRVPRRALRAVLLAGAIGTIAPELMRYLKHYFVEYPKYSAPSYDGFQYGYEESIEFMEDRRGEYDKLVLTATDVNQPQIFPPFFLRQDPEQFLATHQIGYEVFVPEEYARYDPERQRILYQVHPRDVRIFEDYEVLKDITAPSGELVYRIIEPKRRKAFIQQWLAYGPLPPDLQNIPEPLRQAVAWDPWRPVDGSLVLTNLNNMYGANAENMCAVVSTQLVLDGPPRAASLECVGSEDRIAAELNGQRVLVGSELQRESAVRVRIQLNSGANLLQVLTCETVGDWNFACAVVGPDGKSLREVTSRDPRH